MLVLTQKIYRFAFTEACSLPSLMKSTWLVFKWLSWPWVNSEVTGNVWYDFVVFTTQWALFKAVH